MPKPKTDETREAYLHRFMGSDEARRDYPDEKQRFSAAAALWEHRTALEAANALGYNAERDGAEAFGGRHLQPGLVGYPEMKHPITGKQGIDILVEKEVIDRMRSSARGIPVVNWAHDMSGGATKWIADGRAVGVVVGSHWDGESGWECPETMIWDKEAKANCRNGFRWSNAWKEDEIDWTPGVHNGKPYDGRLIAAHYTHLAIVPNPRYEGAVIFANTLLGGLMFNLFGKDGKTVELDKSTPLEVNGKKRTLEECVNALAAADAAAATVTAAKGSELKDDDVVEVGGKKRTVLEMKNALMAADKIAAAAQKKGSEAATTEVGATPIHETPEFQNAVDARVKEAVEKMVGDGFFNGIQDLARRRPADATQESSKSHRTVREREAAGRKRWGSKKTAETK